VKQTLKRRYVSPLVKRTQVQLDRRDLQFFGRCLIKFVREEAEKDAAKMGQLPTAPEFYKSFSFRVKGNGIEVMSSWPWIRVYTEGTNGPFRMKWLTRQEGVNVVPLRGKFGEVVFRTAPLTTDKAWIHPGIARHTFIQRAFKRAQKSCVERFLLKNLGQILDGALG